MAVELPPIGSKWRRVNSGRRYTVTEHYSTWTSNPTIELTPEPGERGRKTWLSKTGFAAKFEAVPDTEEAAK